LPLIRLPVLSNVLVQISQKRSSSEPYMTSVYLNTVRVRLKRQLPLEQLTFRRGRHEIVSCRLFQVDSDRQKGILLLRSLSTSRNENLVSFEI